MYIRMQSKLQWSIPRANVESGPDLWIHERFGQQHSQTVEFPNNVQRLESCLIVLAKNEILFASVVVMHIQIMCKSHYNLIIAICSGSSPNHLPNSFTLCNTLGEFVLDLGFSKQV